jgi:hypothetical protein
MNYYSFILTLFFICPKLFCVPIIQLSLIPNNQIYKNRITEKLESKENEPLPQPIEAGHIVTYGGFVDVSDFDGLVSFPRKQAGRSIYLLITPEVTPISMFHNTLSHWELIRSMPSRFYKIEQIQNEQTKKNSWETTEVELPSDNIIPLDTVILFMDPQYARPLSKEQESLKSENLLIPPIELDRGVDDEKNAIVFLKIRHFFSSTSPAFNKQASRYEISLKP